MKRVLVAACIVRKIHKRSAIPLIEDNGLFYIELQVPLAKYKFVIDTGANRMVIFKNAYNKINTECNIRRVEDIKTANGIIRCPIIGFNFSIENKLFNFDMTIMPNKSNFEYDGIIGTSFLKALKASIDFDNKQLTLTSNGDN